MEAGARPRAASRRGPRSRRRPSVGSVMRDRILSSVLLPAPLRPIAAAGFWSPGSSILFRATVVTLLEGSGELRAGNALLNIACTAGAAVGPALAGLAVAGLGLQAALFLNAASFYLVAWILLTAGRIPRSKPEAGAPPIGYAPGSPTSGPTSASSVPGRPGHRLRLLLAVSPIEVIAKESLGTSDTGYGVMLAAWGTGMLLGSFVFASAKRAPLSILFVLSTLVIGACGSRHRTRPRLRRLGDRGHRQRRPVGFRDQRKPEVDRVGYAGTGYGGAQLDRFCDARNRVRDRRRDDRDCHSTGHFPGRRSRRSGDLLPSYDTLDGLPRRARESGRASRIRRMKPWARNATANGCRSTRTCCRSRTSSTRPSGRSASRNPASGRCMRWSSRGVQYIEVRCLFNQPVQPTGISLETTRFHGRVSAGIARSKTARFCRAAPTRKPTKLPRASRRKAASPAWTLARDGREVPMQGWADSLLDGIEPVAQALDALHGIDEHMTALKAQRARLADVSLTRPPVCSKPCASGIKASTNLRLNSAQSMPITSVAVRSALTPNVKWRCSLRSRWTIRQESSVKRSVR